MYGSELTERTPGLNSNVKYGLWVIMMYQHRFIDGNGCTPVVWEHSGVTPVGAVGTRKLCTSCSVFAVISELF